MKDTEFNFIKDGKIGLITTDNGRIVQLAMTEEQNTTIQFLIGLLSQKEPLIKMDEEHDLVLKSTVKNYKKRR
jgi:hypothetical protein